MLVLFTIGGGVGVFWSLYCVWTGDYFSPSPTRSSWKDSICSQLDERDFWVSQEHAAGIATVLVTGGILAASPFPGCPLPHFLSSNKKHLCMCGGAIVRLGFEIVSSR